GLPARRPGDRLGGHTARVHAVFEWTARPGRLAGGVRLAAGEHSHLDGIALSRASAPASPAARLAAQTAGPEELSDARGRLDRRNRALAGDAAVRARGGRYRREHRPVRVPD